jgi:8-oxo-dGTP pyrophosphatase MutT (NUDIX family)
MRILKNMDSKDYDESSPRTTRNAVRAIILSGKKLLMIRSDKFGEYKFPGGGAKPGETHSETILRETREETGLTVIPSSIREYGMTREIHQDAYGDGIFEQNSYYYLCGVEDGLSETALDEYEKDYGYKLAITSVDDAINANAALCGKAEIPWARRELMILRHIKENLTPQGGLRDALKVHHDLP